MKKNKKYEFLNNKISFFHKNNYNSLLNTTYLTYINNDISKNNKSKQISYFINNYDNKNYSKNTKLYKYLSNTKNISFNKMTYKPQLKKLNIKNIKSIFNDDKSKNSTSLDYHKISYNNKNNSRNIKKIFPYPDIRKLFSKIPLIPFLNINSDKNKNNNDEFRKKIIDFYYNKNNNLNLLPKEMINKIENDKNKEKNKSNNIDKNIEYNQIYLKTDTLSKKRIKNFIRKRMFNSINNAGRSYLVNIKNNKRNKDKKSFNNIFSNLEIKKYFNTNQEFPYIYQNEKEKNDYKSIISKNKSFNNEINNLFFENDITINNYSFSNQNYKIKSIASKNKYNSISEENNKINNNIKFKDKCIGTYDEI